MTGANVITRARTLIGDQRQRRFTDDEMLEELNTIIREVCSDLPWYKKTQAVPMRDKVSVYEFPDDMIEIVAMNQDDALYGQIVVSSTYQNLVNGESLPSTSLSSYWGFTSGAQVPESSPIYFRDTVSHNEFRIEPQPMAEDVGVSAADSLSSHWAP